METCSGTTTPNRKMTEKEKEKGGQEENKEDSAEVESGEQTKDDVNEVATEKSRYGALETKMGEKGELVYDASLSTGQANVHLDLNPWWWLEDSDDPVVGLNTLSYGVNDNAGTDASTAVRAGEGVEVCGAPVPARGAQRKQETHFGCGGKTTTVTGTPMTRSDYQHEVRAP